METKRTYREYNKYFDGYSEYYDSTDSGGKIKRVYTGTYHRVDGTDSYCIRLKIMIGGLYFLSLSAFLISGFTLAGCNEAKYVMLPTGLALIAYVFCAVSLVYRLTAPRNMISRVYRESVLLLRSRSRNTAIALAMLVAGDLIYLLIHIKSVTLDDIACSLTAGVACAAIFAVYYMENNVIRYVEIKSGVKPPADSVQITY